MWLYLCGFPGPPGPAWCRGLRQRSLLVAPRGVPLRPAMSAAAPGGASDRRAMAMGSFGAEWGSFWEPTFWLVTFFPFFLFLDLRWSRLVWKRWTFLQGSRLDIFPFVGVKPPRVRPNVSWWSLRNSKRRWTVVFKEWWTLKVATISKVRRTCRWCVLIFAIQFPSRNPT